MLSTFATVCSWMQCCCCRYCRCLLLCANDIPATAYSVCVTVKKHLTWKAICAFMLMAVDALSCVYARSTRTRATTHTHTHVRRAARMMHATESNMLRACVCVCACLHAIFPYIWIVHHKNISFVFRTFLLFNYSIRMLQFHRYSQSTQTPFLVFLSRSLIICWFSFSILSPKHRYSTFWQ